MLWQGCGSSDPAGKKEGEESPATPGDDDLDPAPVDDSDDHEDNKLRLGLRLRSLGAHAEVHRIAAAGRTQVDLGRDPRA